MVVLYVFGTSKQYAMVREIKGLKCPNHDRVRNGHHFMYDAVPGCQPTAFPDAFAAERPSPFISIKSRSIMRLFRRIRYIGVRVRRFLNQLVEKILLYDDGITCILPKDETYDKD